MFTIRDYLPDDFEQLWELDQVCFAEGIAYSREELQFYLDRKGSVRFVAYRGDSSHSVAGFLVAEVNKARTAHIITIDVDPGLRRSGLGSQLMRATEERLLACNAKTVLLEVAVDNTAAIHFYKRQRYAVLKTLPRYYKNSIDALLLGKRLDEE